MEEGRRSVFHPHDPGLVFLVRRDVVVLVSSLNSGGAPLGGGWQAAGTSGTAVCRGKK